MPRIHAMYTWCVYASEREDLSSAQWPWTPTTMTKTPMPRATGSGKEDAWPGLTRRPRCAPWDSDSCTGRGATEPVRLRVHLAQRPHHCPRRTQSAHLRELAICAETSDAAGLGAAWNNLGTSPARVGGRPANLAQFGFRGRSTVRLGQPVAATTVTNGWMRPTLAETGHPMIRAEPDPRRPRLDRHRATIETSQLFQSCARSRRAGAPRSPRCRLTDAGWAWHEGSCAQAGSIAVIRVTSRLCSRSRRAA